jgi:hypothetical protein
MIIMLLLIKITITKIIIKVTTESGQVVAADRGPIFGKLRIAGVSITSRYIPFELMV